MHIPLKKKKKKKKKNATLFNSLHSNLLLFQTYLMPPLRPMNYLQLGFNQLTKPARDRWQINYYLKL